MSQVNRKHFMIDEVYTGRCVDGRTRTIVVADVELSGDGGLYLTGHDGEGCPQAAYTRWTHAEYIQAPKDVNGNPRRGWLILDVMGNFVDFINEGYAGTLMNASSGSYPAALQWAASCHNVTVGDYRSRLTRATKGE